MRLDAGGTKHDDGVADAFLFELRERVNVLRKNADGARRSTLHEGGVFVRRFGRVLRLEAFAVGHEQSPNEASYDCRQSAEFRQRLWVRMRRKEYAGKVLWKPVER